LGEISTATALTAIVGNPAKAGSIAGTMVSSLDAKPAVYALVYIKTIEPGTSPVSAGPLALPATFTDEKGLFAVENLPPGAYAVTSGDLIGNAPAWSATIEVKEGVETKLSEPLVRFGPFPPRVGGSGSPASTPPVR
jgi:hypothetical protein